MIAVDAIARLAAVIWSILMFGRGGIWKGRAPAQFAGRAKAERK